jgi:hypothetical protein
MTLAPDYPQTRLALRCWHLDQVTMTVRSLNAIGSKPSWLAKAMASPEGGWPHDQPLEAACASPPKRKKRGEDDGEDPPEHGPVPSLHCTCGIYATTSLVVIDTYLTADAPVLGIVELGSRIIPAEEGYRAEEARLALILLVNTKLTVPHRILRDLAAAYRVPAVIPHSPRAEDYRSLIHPEETVVTDEEVTRFFAENQ